MGVGTAAPHERTWRSAATADLGELIQRWIDETMCRPDAACIAIAGPVTQNRCITTNLPWVVDGAALTVRFGFPVTLVNDFYAAALGVTRLAPSDVVQIGGGAAEVNAPVAVIGAGTGLGEALLLPPDRVVPGEGGHADFGPTTPRELRFAAWLTAREGRASWELVLSGPGLVNLARFSFEDDGEPAPAWLDEAEAPARVSRELPAVVEWFAELYGSEAGNAALRSLARGGVYLCGGIAPTILPTLQRGAFRARFEAKGKLGSAIAGVPVFVVTHPALGLLGAEAELRRRAVLRAG